MAADEQSQYSLVVNEDEDENPRVVSINYLNDRKTRLTFWCMVYFVNAMAINKYLIQQFYVYQNTGSTQVLALSITANICFLGASVILMCSMYCKSCKATNLWVLCSAFFFFAGFIFCGAAVIRGITLTCIHGFHWRDLFDNTAWCRIAFEGRFLFFQLFSIFLAVDVALSIGDEIRKRLFFTSLFLAATGYLQGVFYAHQLYEQRHSRWSDAADLYPYRTVCTGYFVVGIMSSFIVLFSYFDGLQKKMNSTVATIISLLLLAGVAEAIWPWMNLLNYSVYLMNYFSVASLLVVYDLYHL